MIFNEPLTTLVITAPECSINTAPPDVCLSLCNYV